MKKALYLLLTVVAAALAIRLYPTAVSGMPFSVDAWPLIRNTELLLQNTPTSIVTDIFDGYNNYWPGSQMFGAVLSQVTGLSPAVAMAWGIPVAAASAVPIFYLLVKRVTQSQTISLAAAFLLATAFPYALFTAGVTKETLASPLYISVLLIFLLRHNWKTAALFSVVSAALILTHHLTAFFAITSVAGLTIAFLISKNIQQPQNSFRSNFVFFVILSAATALYFGLFAYPAFTLTVTAADMLSLGAYEALLFGLSIYVAYSAKPPAAKKTLAYCAIWLLMISLVVILVTQVPLMPGAPTLPPHYLFYALPFIAGMPLAIYAFKDLRHRTPSLLTPLFWVVTAGAFSLFALFANLPGGVGLFYRSINFVLPPFLILIAFGLYRLAADRRVFRRLSVFAVGVLAVCMASVGAYSVYATVSLEEPYFGYFWRYEPSEVQAGSWVAAAAVNQTVAGDSKVSYLLSGYFNRSVSISRGINYLDGDGSPPELLYVYRQMYRNGYVLYYGSPAALPPNWTDQLTGYNQVYGNSEVTIYAKQ
jgi:hypothetical protein